MKVLSLLQPWASLVVLGHKKIETRSWNTKHRGPLLIHASLGRSKIAETLWISALQEYGVKPPTEGHYHFTELPFGAIIGMVNVVATCRTDINVIYQKNIFVEDEGGFEAIHLTRQEHAFGDYSPGRYGWLFSDPVMFDEPIPAKGKLNLWNYNGPLPNNVDI